MHLAFASVNLNFESALQVESCTLQSTYIVTNIPFHALSMIMNSFINTFLCTHIFPWQHPHIYSCIHNRLPTSGSVCISCPCTRRNLQEKENIATAMEQKILMQNKFYHHESRKSSALNCKHTF